jgi:uncharacterized membrane protein
LLAASVTPAAAGELLAIRALRGLRHHSRPQIGDLPLLIPLQWYSVIAPAYGLAEAAVGEQGPVAVAATTALLATATDLANDPWALANGYWEWRDGGSYMPDIVGPNGVAGIPIGNYAGWLIIAGLAALIAERGRPVREARAVRRFRTLLLLLYYLLGSGGLGWAVRERRWRLAATAIFCVLGGGFWAWRAATGAQIPA